MLRIRKDDLIRFWHYTGNPTMWQFPKIDEVIYRDEKALVEDLKKIGLVQEFDLDNKQISIAERVDKE